MELTCDFCDCDAATLEYDYLFSENGLVAYKAGKLIGNQVIAASLKAFIFMFTKHLYCCK